MVGREPVSGHAAQPFGLNGLQKPVDGVLRRRRADRTPSPHLPLLISACQTR